MDRDYLFVYGTLKRESKLTIAQWLHKQTKFEGLAKIPGYIRWVAGANPYPAFFHLSNSKNFVSGEVFSFPMQLKAKIFYKLDAYEWANPPKDEADQAGVYRPPATFPAEYQRLKKTVDMEGKPLEAWLYEFINPKHPRLLKISNERPSIPKG